MTKRIISSKPSFVRSLLVLCSASCLSLNHGARVTADEAASRPQSVRPTKFHNSTKQFTPPAEMTPTDWSDPEELKRTWEAALLRIPYPDKSVIRTSMWNLDSKAVPEGHTFPTVIYLHGCSGVWKGTYQRMDFLAKNGFAVIAPVSFARQKYPRSCNTQTHEGGLYRPTLKMRQNDAEHAIRMAKALPWVDTNHVFLMGLSQGGITTATFASKEPGTSVRARVVEGWTCHAGWPEYGGLNAPPDEPVLTLVAGNDPWFQRPFSRGDCGTFLHADNGSRSIVYATGRLKNRHELLEFREAQEAVLTFLRAHVQKKSD